MSWFSRFGKQYEEVKIRLFNCFWGQYEEWYDQYTLPSLRYSIDRLKLEGHEVRYVGHRAEQPPKRPGEYLLEALLNEIDQSSKEDAYTFLANPDMLFSDNLLYNCAKLAEGKACSIAVPHNRIGVASVVGSQQFSTFPVSSQTLVDAFLGSDLHYLKNLDDRNGHNICYTGVTIRQLDHGCWVMTHCLPAVWLAKFDSSDHAFFQGRSWNEIDRGWLEKIFNEKRLKIVGSSDIAYGLELSLPEHFSYPTRENQYNDQYDYYEHKFFNSAMSMTEFLLKGGEARKWGRGLARFWRGLTARTVQHTRAASPPGRS